MIDEKLYVPIPQYLDRAGVMHHFGLANGFINQWTSDAARAAYKNKKCGIPPMPCIKAGTDKFHSPSIAEWLQNFVPK